jgi:hypothetical protein
MIYLASWAIGYLVLILYRLGLTPKAFLIFYLLFIGALVAIRDSGTDTRTYEMWLSLIQQQDLFDSLATGIEPLFVICSWTLLGLGFSDVLALRILAVFYVILWGLFLLRSKEDECYLAFLYLIPVFFFPYGMNTVRAGLGLSILLLSWQDIRRGRFWRALALITIASLFHYSLLLAAFLLLWIERGMPRIWVMVISLVLFLAATTWLSQKLLLYTQRSALITSVSGLSRIALIATVLAGVALTRRISLSSKASLMFPILFISLAAFAAVFVMKSYAGLRVLDLVAIMAPLMSIRVYDLSNHKPDDVFWFTLGLAGVLGLIFSYRVMLLDYGGQLTGAETPFLPYKTIFDVR